MSSVVAQTRSDHSQPVITKLLADLLADLLLAGIWSHRSHVCAGKIAVASLVKQSPVCCHVAVAGPGGVQQVHVPPGMLSTLLGIKLVIGLPRSLFNHMLESTAVCESAGTVIKSELLPP